MKNINVAIIGFGVMGRRYFNILKQIKNFKVCYILDKKKNFLKNQKFKDDINFFNDYSKVLKIKKIDLVIVSTTANVRHKIIMSCIKNKIKYILAEKPLCKSLKEANEILRFSKKKHSKISINFSRRYSATYEKIKYHIKNKEIGDLKSITIQMGGGQFGSNGSHMVDLIRFLMGEEALSVSGYLSKPINENYRGKNFFDPGAFCMIKTKNGIRAIIDMLDDHSSPPTISILGSKGRIFFDEREKFYSLYTREKKFFSEPVSKRISFKHKKIKCAKIDIIKDTRKNIMNLVSKDKIKSQIKDGFKSLEIILATHLSYQNKNRFIKIPITKKNYLKTFKFA
tara:strand:- start:15093 stop:16112 length:1020 start_codon:yes stop_codon:yes gene_type:complete